MRLRAALRNVKHQGQKAFRFRETFRDLVLLDRPDFNGPAYERKMDRARLAGQILRVYELMADAEWRTLDEIAQLTGDPPASVSAQLRHLRKERFGKHTIEKRRRSQGLWEYRMGGCA